MNKLSKYENMVMQEIGGLLADMPQSVDKKNWTHSPLHTLTALGKYTPASPSKFLGREGDSN